MKTRSIKSLIPTLAASMAMNLGQGGHPEVVDSGSIAPPLPNKPKRQGRKTITRWYSRSRYSPHVGVRQEMKLAARKRRDDYAAARNRAWQGNR